MNAHEAGEKLILWWRLEYPLPFMALWICMLYYPLTVREILFVVRRYCDHEPENAHPEPGEITWRK